MQTQAMHSETSGHPGGDPTIQLELSERANQQLVGMLSTDGTIVPLAATSGGIGSIPSKSGLGQLRLLPAGETLCQLADVADVISDEERDHWLEALRGPSLW
jgi:hypothetical protein